MLVALASMKRLFLSGHMLLNCISILHLKAIPFCNVLLSILCRVEIKAKLLTCSSLEQVNKWKNLNWHCGTSLFPPRVVLLKVCVERLPVCQVVSTSSLPVLCHAPGSAYLPVSPPDTLTCFCSFRIFLHLRHGLRFSVFVPDCCSEWRQTLTGALV